MEEAQHVGMQAQAVDGVVAVAVLHVATNGVSHVCRVYPDLVLASRLQLELYERVLGRTVEDVEMGHGIFAAVVHGTGVGYVCAVVLKPVGYGTLVLDHLSAQHGNIPAVVDDIVPIPLQCHLRLHVLGIDHQSRGVAVEPVYDMCRTPLPAGLEIVVEHGLDVTGFIAAGGDYSEAIMKIIDTLPLTEFGLILLAVTMVAFYSTTFDALTMVVSSYSYKRLKPEQEPDKRIRTFWAVVFILLPIALIFSENSMNSLQSVSIIAAFPIGIIILIIVASFFKDASSYLRERKDI